MFRGRRRDIEIIHIDNRPAHINKLYQTKVEVIEDISPDKKVLTITGDGGFMMNCQ